MLVVNPFARRQTTTSRFSHFDGSEDTLLALIGDAFDKARDGYTQGVLEVPLSPEGFYSGVVTLREGQGMVATYKARRDGEEPRKEVAAAGGDKLPAKSVTIILYSSILLAKDGDNSLPPEVGNWEVISINASSSEGREPINPETLMHNHFGSSGGTATGMSDAEFVAALREAFLYWKDKAMLA